MWNTNTFSTQKEISKFLNISHYSLHKMYWVSHRVCHSRATLEGSPGMRPPLFPRRAPENTTSLERSFGVPQLQTKNYCTVRTITHLPKT